MIIAATADLHGFLPDTDDMPVCDILLIGGDVCPVRGGHGITRQTYWLESEFEEWLQNIYVDGVAKHIVGIAGNHDFAFKNWKKDDFPDLSWHYLHNSAIEIDGVMIWGSPFSPTFGGWAFMAEEVVLAEMYEKIPFDTNIVLSHGPPKYICDTSTYLGMGMSAAAGSSALTNRLHYGEFPSLRHVVFGHIHEAHGHEEIDHVDYWNVSMMDSDYEPTNPIIVIET